MISSILQSSTHPWNTSSFLFIMCRFGKTGCHRWLRWLMEPVHGAVDAPENGGDFDLFVKKVTRSWRFFGDHLLPCSPAVGYLRAGQNLWQSKQCCRHINGTPVRANLQHASIRLTQSSVLFPHFGTYCENPQQTNVFDKFWQVVLCPHHVDRPAETHGMAQAEEHLPLHHCTVVHI